MAWVFRLREDEWGLLTHRWLVIQQSTLARVIIKPNHGQMTQPADLKCKSSLLWDVIVICSQLAHLLLCNYSDIVQSILTHCIQEPQRVWATVVFISPVIRTTTMLLILCFIYFKWVGIFEMSFYLSTIYQLRNCAMSPFLWHIFFFIENVILQVLWIRSQKCKEIRHSRPTDG